MKPLVVVVDDSLTVRMDLTELLESAGVGVRACSTLRELHALLAELTPDLLILDVHLPDGNGREALAQLRKEPRTASLPVLLLTSANEVPDRVAGMRAGADEYVGKPYNRDYVVSRVLALVRPRAAGRARPLVLVMDDSLTVRESLRAALEDAGMDVAAAADGEEGLRLCERLRPNALIIDYHMPRLDGFGVLRRLRADPILRNIPCLLLTGSANAPEEVLGLESGADVYARKGDPLDLVIARMMALMRRQGRPTGQHLGGKKVLLIGSAGETRAPEPDESAVIEAAHLERADVVRARSLGEAQQVLEAERIHCIVIPASPEARAFCCEIKDLGGRARVLMLVPDGRPDLAVQALQSCADDFLPYGSGVPLIRARLRTQILRGHIDDENEQIRQEQLARERARAEARAARELAELRARMLERLEEKNQELEHARQQAEVASAFKTRFLANMFHEVRTPLNAVLGFSELLSTGTAGPLNERQLGYVEQVTRAAVHLLGLIEEVLDISAIEAGKLRLDIRPTDPSSIVSEALDLIRPLAEGKGLHLVHECQASLWADVDPQRLRQVLYNLLSNAIKFSDPGTTVTIRCQRDGGRLRIEVEDQGIGIAEEDMPRLFQPFERLAVPGRPRPEGTGLGLSLVRTIVEMHRGKVSVVSEPGRGTTFIVRIPLQHVPGGHA